MWFNILNQSILNEMIMIVNRYSSDNDTISCPHLKYYCQLLCVHTKLCVCANIDIIKKTIIHSYQSLTWNLIIFRLVKIVPGKLGFVYSC